MTAYRAATGVERVAYRVREVASALGLTESAVYQQIGSGAVPHVQIGGRVYVPAGFFRDLGLQEPLVGPSSSGRKELFTVAQVAAAIGTSIPNIYQLTGRNIIPAHRQDGRRLIPAGFFADLGLDVPGIGTM